MGTGKKKIEIQKISKQQARMVAFSKRRQGLFKKAGELSSRTGAHIALVVFSPTGKPYTYGEPSVDTTIDRYVATTAITSSSSGVEYCSRADNNNRLKAWLMESMKKVGECNKIEDIMVLKKQLEEMRATLRVKIALQPLTRFLMED